MQLDSQHHEHEDRQDDHQHRGIEYLLAGNHVRRVALPGLNVNGDCAQMPAPIAQGSTKKVRTEFADIVWFKAPDLPCSSVFPVRLPSIAMAMPSVYVEKMAHRTLLESTSFPSAKDRCPKTDAWVCRTINT
jgi:hypothetical protein